MQFRNMAEVQLKVNMIWDGSHYPIGTVLNESEIPSNLRKAKFIGPFVATSDGPMTLSEQEELESETYDEIEIEEEKPATPAPPPSRFRLRRHK
jgi:hypothetical protein